MKAIDFTSKYEIGSDKRVLSVNLVLSREEMCEALRNDYVIINGIYYHTPIGRLLDLIAIGKYDESVRFDIIAVTEKE